MPARSKLPDIWVANMRGEQRGANLVTAHKDRLVEIVGARVAMRADREALEDATLATGATRALGGGRRRRLEEPDATRTCFEKDRDRIIHSKAFRRLAGKTQVFVFPADHQRTRLTHALEVTQVASAIARATGLNVALTEAIALGHDCGHGPGGHASEEVFDEFLPGGFHHATWGAGVVLEPLNLCEETLDGIGSHSWSLPAPSTPEGAVVSWADRIAYCAHDLEDAVHAGIVDVEELPDEVAATAGTTRSQQLDTFIDGVISCIASRDVVGMDADRADALARLRAFNYERIYNRPESIAQGAAVRAVLMSLLEYFLARPDELPASEIDKDPVTAAVQHVDGMTDRYAFETAVLLLGWDRRRLPRGIDVIGTH